MATSLALDQQIIALRPQLLRFARQRIKNHATVEDVVQDSLLAVLENPERYAGKSTLSTYVIGILKFKIIDSFRRSRLSDVDLDELYETVFPGNDIEQNAPNDRYGISHSSLCDKLDPLTSLEQKAFFDSLEFALQQLPPQSARAFTLWEYLEMDSGEICDALDIKKNHLMVTIHRAKHALRKSPALQNFASA